MPSNLSVTNLTSTTADLSWTGGTGTFIYEYTALGSMNTQSGTSSTTTASLSGLMSSTSYDLFLMEVCAPGDTSMRMYATFTTDSCAAISFGNPSYNLDSVTISNATFTFDWSGATGYTSFDINFGDGNSSNGASATVSHAYGSNGNYTVTLTLYGDCDTATTSFTVSVNSIGFDEYGIGTLVMYPIPSSGLITMDGVIDGVSEVRVRVLNYLGQEILVDQWQSATDQFNKTYDLSDEAAGMYLFEVSTDKGMIQKPVVIKH
jgi:PKD repeat protein